ncbi:MAG: hypothetical protein EPO21_15675 [Chloroflexota bacterium]|nr:MAG: hypothetical protein EPO21_15675 [Chloroflexota bacterium]
MKRKIIPEQTKQWADGVIQEFNERVIRDPHRYFTARYRGSYLYLDRWDYGTRARPRCRLTYTGDPDHWDFAIFKYSDECYDPTEWFFTGAEFVDGTLPGALRAAMAAYP